MHFTRKDLETADRKFRLNLVNSITGVKPANLIGTISEEGNTNLAIFSSIIHLGSNPAFLGFVMRPTADVPRHTYENIVKIGRYTINAVPLPLIENAHFTSAKFDRHVSEFESCNIHPTYIDDFDAPFVLESPIKIGMKWEEEIPIKSNGTILMIGSVEHIILEDGLVNEKGYLNLAGGNVVGIGGLNRYFSLKQVGEFPYARLSEVPDFS